MLEKKGIGFLAKSALLEVGSIIDFWIVAFAITQKYWDVLKQPFHFHTEIAEVLVQQNKREWTLYLNIYIND